MSYNFCWTENKEFVEWLYKEFSSSELAELEQDSGDDVVSLIYLGWLAGRGSAMEET